MKRLLLLAALLIPAAVPAAGTQANLAWTPPTQYVDGTTLTPSEIAFYTISYAKGPSNATVIVNPPATTAAIVIPCGSTIFYISVTTTPTATYPNAVSGQSLGVTYNSGVQCVPKAPTNFTAS